jgi:hypothetical protein
MIEELIALNRLRLAERQERAEISARRSGKRRPMLERLEKAVLEQERQRKRRAVLERQRGDRLKAEQARREARTWTPRRAGPKDTAQRDAQWVTILTQMEPGRWYGSKVMQQITGVQKPFDRGAKWATKLFVDRALNPAWQGDPWLVWCPRELVAMSRRGEFPEPKWLYRLNRWGEALRTAVLDRPGTERIELLELDGAKPEAWWQATEMMRVSRMGWWHKSRGGRSVSGTYRGNRIA